MPKKDSDNQLIEKYLLGRLSGAETQSFKERQKDTDFQKELNWQQEMMPAIKKKGRNELKNRLKSLEEGLQKKQTAKKETTPNPKPLGISFRRIVSIAAGFALIFSFFWWWNAQSTATPTDLFAQYYEDYSNVVAPIVKSEEVISTYQQGFQSYEQGNYEEAEQQLKIFSDKEESQFYLALSYLAQDKTTAALPIFQRIAEQPDARFYQASQWYLAMTYLKQGDAENAKKIIDLIEGMDEHPFQNKARELRDLLN